MTITIKGRIKMLTPDADKTLTNGSVYSDSVYTNKDADISMWNEIPKQDVPVIDDTEASEQDYLNQLNRLGVEV